MSENPQNGAPQGENIVVAENLTFEEVKRLTEEHKKTMPEAGLSKGMSTALKRGDTLAEKKSSWPFDFYQCTNLFPVDYTYWSCDHQSDCGPTQLITMHSNAYTSEGENFAADQIYHRRAMRSAHFSAMGDFINVQRNPVSLKPFMTKEDKWGKLQSKLLPKGRLPT